MNSRCAKHRITVASFLNEHPSKAARVRWTLECKRQDTTSFLPATSIFCLLEKPISSAFLKKHKKPAFPRSNSCPLREAMMTTTSSPCDQYTNTSTNLHNEIDSVMWSKKSIQSAIVVTALELDTSCVKASKRLLHYQRSWRYSFASQSKHSKSSGHEKLAVCNWRITNRLQQSCNMTLIEINWAFSVGKFVDRKPCCHRSLCVLYTIS